MIIKGSILESDCNYIVHQCNSVSTEALGLAKFIFDIFPYANIYKDREEKSIPGTIVICNEGTKKIINLIGQYYPGKANDSNDTIELREKWFYKCLGKISKIPNLISIAFPYNIGCGLAGGNWDHYHQMIINFAKYVEESQKTIVKIYQK
jgi:O-acetyl-ADP-ribose deacetylase (regulator of RNase III)